MVSGLWSYSLYYDIFFHLYQHFLWLCSPIYRTGVATRWTLKRTIWLVNVRIRHVPIASRSHILFAHAPRIRWAFVLQCKISDKTLNYMNSRCLKDQTITKTSGLYNNCSYLEVHCKSRHEVSERNQRFLAIHASETLTLCCTFIVFVACCCHQICFTRRLCYKITVCQPIVSIFLGFKTSKVERTSFPCFVISKARLFMTIIHS